MKELCSFQELPSGSAVEESAWEAGDCRRDASDPCMGKNPWRRKCQSTPAFLPGKSDGQRSLVGLGVAKSDTTDWLCTYAVFKDFTCNTPCFLLFSCSVLSDSVTLSMDCSTPGFPVPEFSQTHVHWVGDTIQPSHPLLSLFPPVLNLSKSVKKKKGRTSIIFILQLRQVRFG